MRKVAEIGIESLTPSAIGGYDPNKHDDILRGTSIRGLAAWWLRAIVSGKAYDRGDPQHKEKAKKAQEMILGSTESSSLLTIKVNIGEEGIRSLNENDKQGLVRVEQRRGRKPEFRVTGTDNIRLSLLLMGKKAESERKLRGKLSLLLGELFKIFSATILVYSSSKKVLLEEALGLHALVLALLLEGIGKGSRRGLGALKITGIKLSGDMEAFLSKNGYRGLLGLTSGVKGHESVEEVIEDALKIAEKLIEKMEQAEEKSYKALEKPPEIPSLSRNAVEIYVKRLHPSSNYKERLANINTILEDLFLRRAGKNKLVACLQEVSGNDAKALGSYILGLPRAAKSPPRKHHYTVRFNPNPEKEKTRTRKCFTDETDVPSDIREQYSGFVKLKVEVKKDKEGKEKKEYNYEHYRRPSPLIVSLIDERTIVMSFFKSSDWPGELQWFTSHQKEVTVRSITDAYNIVSNYLQRNFIKVWP